MTHSKDEEVKESYDTLEYLTQLKKVINKLINMEGLNEKETSFIDKHLDSIDVSIELEKRCIKNVG